MKKFLFGSILIALLFSIISCHKKAQNIPHYTISKVFKTDTLTTLNVHIGKRMTATDLMLIAGKLKADSINIKNLAVHYLLPGNTDLSAGDNSFYAAVRFLKDTEVKSTDSLKDDDGHPVRLKIYGLDSTKAQQLLALQPDITFGKTILGRFIDDYNHTVIIPFRDPTDKKDEIFVIELDATGKIVSATVPHKKVEDGVEKWLVTQNGDYITIKDSVLAQYPENQLGLPYNSIKSGI